MPSTKSSFADIVLDSDKLIAAVTTNAALLPNIEELRVPLEQAVAEVRAVSVRQQNLTGDRQKATQDLKAAVARARDLTIELRAAVKSKLGVRNEKLTEFRIQPLRKRQRTPKTAITPPPASCSPTGS
jgi:hypothetical protein